MQPRCATATVPSRRLLNRHGDTGDAESPRALPGTPPGQPTRGDVPKRGAGSWRPSCSPAVPPRCPLPRPSPQASAPAVPPVRPRPPGPAAAGAGRGRGEGGRWSRRGSRPRFSGSPAFAPLRPSCVTPAPRELEPNPAPASCCPSPGPAARDPGEPGGAHTLTF